MKLLSAICIAIIGSALMSSNVSANEISDNHCGMGEVIAVAEAGIEGSILSNYVGVPPVGLAGAEQRCQFRFYDDNGPDMPHTWYEDELFLGGAYFFPRFTPGDRDTTIDRIESTVLYLYVGPVNAPDEDLEPIELTDGQIKGVPVAGRWLIYRHTYFIGENWAPGHYRWVSLVEDPEGVAEGGRGEIVILPVD